jgi:hypothetical protein
MLALPRSQSGLAAAATLPQHRQCVCAHAAAKVAATHCIAATVCWKRDTLHWCAVLLLAASVGSNPLAAVGWLQVRQITLQERSALNHTWCDRARLFSL